MLNIISYQGNANQNHNELSLRTHQNGWLIKKTKASVHEALQKFEPLYIAGGNVKWCCHLESNQVVPENVKESYHMTDKSTPRLYTKEKRKYISTQKHVHELSIITQEFPFWLSGFQGPHRASVRTGFHPGSHSVDEGYSVAVAAVQDGSCSSDSTPGLGISTGVAEK